MRFLIDAQLPPALAHWLRTRGYEAIALREVGLRDSTDKVIWNRAMELGAILITKDEDFALLSSQGGRAPVVLWVRTGNLVNRVLITRFERAWPEVECHLKAGARLIEIR